MAYEYAKLRVEPVRGIWFRWKATPINVDTPEHGAAGFDLELDGMYVDAHPFRFKGRTRQQAVDRARRWMTKANAREAAITYEAA